MYGRDWLGGHAGCQEVGRCHTKAQIILPDEMSPEVQYKGISSPKKDLCRPKNFKNIIDFVIRTSRIRFFSSLCSCCYTILSVTSWVRGGVIFISLREWLGKFISQGHRLKEREMYAVIYLLVTDINNFPTIHKGK